MILQNSWHLHNSRKQVKLRQKWHISRSNEEKTLAIKTSLYRVSPVLSWVCRACLILSELPNCNVILLCSGYTYVSIHENGEFDRRVFFIHFRRFSLPCIFPWRDISQSCPDQFKAQQGCKLCICLCHQKPLVFLRGSICFCIIIHILQTCYTCRQSWSVQPLHALKTQSVPCTSPSDEKSTSDDDDDDNEDTPEGTKQESKLCPGEGRVVMETVGGVVCVDFCWCNIWSDQNVMTVHAAHYIRVIIEHPVGSWKSPTVFLDEQLLSIVCPFTAVLYSWNRGSIIKMSRCHRILNWI